MPNFSNILLRWLCQRLLITSVLGLWPAQWVLAQTEADAQALLVASDAVRNPPGSFSVQLTLTEFRKGAQTNRSGLLIYAKVLSNYSLIKQATKGLKFYKPLHHRELSCGVSLL